MSKFEVTDAMVEAAMDVYARGRPAAAWKDCMRAAITAAIEASGLVDENARLRNLESLCLFWLSPKRTADSAGVVEVLRSHLLDKENEAVLQEGKGIDIGLKRVNESEISYYILRKPDGTEFRVDCPLTEESIREASGGWEGDLYVVSSVTPALPNPTPLRVRQLVVTLQPQLRCIDGKFYVTESKTDRLNKPTEKLVSKNEIEDVLTTIFSQLHSIEHKLIRAGLKGQMSGGSKTDIRQKLDYIAEMVNKLPQNGEQA
jgi:hypothetical protein